MSFKPELFKGHWYDEGMVFATHAEASAYARSTGIVPYRVSETKDAVNYTYSGSLKPYKAPSVVHASWEDFIRAGGIGIHGGGLPCKTVLMENATRDVKQYTIIVGDEIYGVWDASQQK